MVEDKHPRWHTVELDVYIGRRTRVHQVIDPHGEAVFSAKELIDVLEWLDDNGITEARFTDGEASFSLTAVKRSVQDPTNSET